MPIRVYVIAADSERPLEPTFKRVPGGQLTAAVEIFDLAEFRGLDAGRFRDFAEGLVRLRSGARR